MPMAGLKVIASGATLFARNYPQHLALGRAIPHSDEPRVAWMIGVGGGDEVVLNGEPRNTGTKAPHGVTFKGITSSEALPSR